LKAVLVSISVKEEKLPVVFLHYWIVTLAPDNFSPLLFVFITVVSSGSGQKIATLDEE